MKNKISQPSSQKLINNSYTIYPSAQKNFPPSVHAHNVPLSRRALTTSCSTPTARMINQQQNKRNDIWYSSWQQKKSSMQT